MHFFHRFSGGNEPFHHPLASEIILFVSVDDVVTLSRGQTLSTLPHFLAVDNLRRKDLPEAKPHENTIIKYP